MRTTDTYLNFPGNTLEAFEFYRSVFGGDFEGRMTYEELGGGGWNPPESDRNLIGHISLKVSKNNYLLGSDVSSAQRDSFRMGTNIYVNLNADNEEEARRLFEGLSAGGKVEMALQATAWAQLYGSCVDKFGVPWMVNLAHPQV